MKPAVVNMASPVASHSSTVEYNLTKNYSGTNS